MEAVVHHEETDEDFTRVATLTWTIGTQTSRKSTYEFADTVAVTNEYWGKAWTAVSPTGNYIAEAWVDVAGSSKIAVCPTTVNNKVALQITGN